MHLPLPLPFPSSFLLLLHLLLILPQSLLATPPPSHPHLLTATAIVTNANNASCLECWEFSSPFTVSTDAGTAGAAALNLGSVENVVYTVLPPRYNGGLHRAPKVQLVVFISGLAHITLPTSPNEAWVLGGADGLIVAADTSGSGHITNYPSDEQTIGLQIPFKNGNVPAYRVVGTGACRMASQIVLN